MDKSKNVQKAKRIVPRHLKTFDEPGMTKQSFKDECDINKIMARFQKTGAIDHYAAYAPQYDVVTSTNLHEAMNIVADAETMFEELPSSLRKKFHNDPSEFLDFVQDENNLEEMRELGLANPRQNETINETKKPSVSPASEQQNEAAPAAE